MMDINELLFIGTNKYGQAGIGQKHHNKTFITPKSFAFPIFIKQISCGSHHSALLTIDGNIYTMGSNIHGALGSNPSLNYSFTPTLVEGITQVTKINCGPFHMCAISDGALYSWGKGIDGQLGHGNTKNMPKPTLVESLGNEVEDVSCGTNHTIVSIRREVLMGQRQQKSICYAFGNGIYGQLGTGQSRNSYTPIRVKLQDVQAFAAGDNHSLFIVDGKVYACGDNSSGQLGTLFSKKFSSEPVKVELPQQEIFLSVYAKKYSAALTDRGEVYVWGLRVDFGRPKKLVGSSSSTSQMIEARIGSEKCYSLQSKGVLYEWDIMKGKEIQGNWLCSNHKLVQNNRAILDFSAGEGYLLILGDIVRQIEYNSAAAHNLSCFEDLQSINNSLRIDHMSLIGDKQANSIAYSQIINDHPSKDSKQEIMTPQSLINTKANQVEPSLIKNQPNLSCVPRRQEQTIDSYGLKERKDFNNVVFPNRSKDCKEEKVKPVPNLTSNPLPINLQYPSIEHDTFDLMQSQSSSIQCEPANFLKESIRQNHQRSNRQIVISDSILQSEVDNIHSREIMVKQQRKDNLAEQKENIMTANFQKKNKQKRIDRVMQMLQKSHSISQKTIINSELREDESEASQSRMKENQIIKSNRLLRVEVREKQLKISQLQELLSRKQMEIEAQRELIKLLRQKNQSQYASLERH